MSDAPFPNHPEPQTCADGAEPNGCNPDTARTQRPEALSVLPENVPADLKAQARWIVWGYRWSPDKGKWDKPPADLSGRIIDGTNPGNWHSFDEALGALHGVQPGPHQLDGIGLAMADEDSEVALVAVDLDRCRDTATGDVAPWAMAIVEKFATYTEVSPSGTGLRLFCRGRLAPAGRRKGPVEVYRKGHYLTVTGQTLNTTPTTVNHRQEAIDWLLATHIDPPHEPSGQPTPPPPHPSPSSLPLDDADLLDRALRSKQGDKLRSLLDGSSDGYPSDSEADLATCCILAYWMSKDATRIERIFSTSSRGQRDKWKDRTDYRERTISKAISLTTDVYDPERPPPGEVHHEQPDRAQPAGPNPEGGSEQSADPAQRDATVADLIAADAGTRWRWEGWVSDGNLHALASQEGIGKTRLMADLTRRIHHALPWPDGSAATFPKGSKVLWVPSDFQHNELVSLCREFDIPAEAIILNTTANHEALYLGTTLDHDTEVRALEARIRRTSPALAFVDTVMNATQKDVTKPHEASAFFKPLARVARLTGVPIFALTHLNAQGKALGLRIRGCARIVWELMQPDPDGQPNRRKLRVEKSAWVKPPALGVTMGNSGNDYDRDPPVAPAPDDEPGTARKRESKVEQAALWLVKTLAGGTSRVAAIRTAGEKVGIDSKLLYRAKAKLGVLESGPKGALEWSLPDCSQEAAE
jgi:hypothetical protein